MIDTDAKSWLPENYQNFIAVTSSLDRIRWAKRGVIVAAYSGSQFFGPEAKIVALLVSGFFLLGPELNPYAMKLIVEQQALARIIATRENWAVDNLSNGYLVILPKRTLTLANQLAPIKKGFKKDLTPTQRMVSFEKKFEEVADKSSLGERGRNLLRSVVRSSLNLGERYWEFTASDNRQSTIALEEAKSMVEAIRNGRAVLASNKHFSFQNY